MNKWLMTVGGLLVLAAGCRGKAPEAGTVPQPNPQARVATDVDERVKLMREMADQLKRLAAGLPAPNEQGQREPMRQVFDYSSRLLPLLMGPEADGQFRLQQRIVSDARDQLASSSADKLAQEPTVDSGLRAIYNALVRISQESFYTSRTVTADLTQLQNRVNALDQARGAMHREAAAKASQQAAALMDRMVHIYESRLSQRAPEPAVPNPLEKQG